MEFVEEERVEENRGAEFIRGGSAAYGVRRGLFEKLIVFLIWFFFYRFVIIFLLRYFKKYLKYVCDACVSVCMGHDPFF